MGGGGGGQRDRQTGGGGETERHTQRRRGRETEKDLRGVGGPNDPFLYLLSLWLHKLTMHA